MRSTEDELADQNRVLRERIAQLESARLGDVDPVVRALLEHSPAYINVVSPHGRFLATGRTNEAFGSVIGRTVFDFTNPSHHATMREAFARVCETGQPVVYESVGYGENGEPDHTYVVRAIPVVELGQVTALVLVPMDITEHTQLEHSLIESEQAMRLAVNASRMGLWRWDLQRDEVTWDARTVEIFGATGTPSNYHQYMQLIHPDDRLLVEGVVRNAQETGVYPTFEHRLSLGADRSERWILAAGAVIKGPTGQPMVMLGGVLDITEQKRFATQLQRAERVEALGQLTAGLAHNFNNLLAAILPNVELALLEATDGIREPLSAALDAALQARDLINSMMALAGSRGLQAHEPSDPKDVVRRLEAICKLTFPREIQVMASIDARTGLVAMSTSDLEQVLLNLLFNARDAVLEAQGGQRQIHVLVDRVGPSAGLYQTRIRIADTGIGMTEAVRNQIFVPFFTTKPPNLASGLGLANALSRVRDAGGQLDCESESGRGTTFTLLLPEGARARRSLRPPITPETAADRVAAILVVDDEPPVRAVTARLLKGAGYEVLETGSAHEARETLRANGQRIKLILLDQSMPLESGLEALSSLQRLCSAPVVLFSGLTSKLPAGVTALLQKPTRSAELLQLVREVLNVAL